MSGRRGHVATATAFSCALGCAACFIGYDSRWGQSKASQQRLAARATPSALGATPDDSRQVAVKRTFRIRFRPNPHYLSQTINAQRQLEDLVEDANRVLHDTPGLHLDVVRTEPWSFAVDEKLDGALTALMHDDPGQDVDVVVGFIGSLPRPSDALHEVGMAEVLGKHLVVRAASRLGEYDAVDRAFVDLSDEARDRVVRARRRHRAVAVFLHEIGHILGALHEADAASVMHTAYDPTMRAFGDDAVILMRLALEDTDHAAVLRAQLDYIQHSKTASWAAGERDAAIVRLATMSGNAHPAASSEQAQPAPTPNEPADVPPELKGDDRGRFVRAMAMFRQGAVGPAFEAAAPLFASYPNNYKVQDLRCQLATVRWLAKDALLAECAGSIRLADAGTEGGP